MKFGLNDQYKRLPCPLSKVQLNCVKRVCTGAVTGIVQQALPTAALPRGVGACRVLAGRWTPD